MIKYLSSWISFVTDFFCFRSMDQDRRFPMDLRRVCFFGRDKSQQSSFDAHYIFHTSWAARILKRTLPKEHIDISSSLYFVGIVSAFIPVRFYDYRPVSLPLSGLVVGSADLTSLEFPDNSIFSLSCMHVVEHIGLGRYGDPIDPSGDLKAINELKRVLSLGGDLLFVTPVGSPRIIFHAHRIYAYSQIMKYFDGLKLMEFMLVLDDGSIVHDAPESLANAQEYGCGCFWFRKE